MSDLARAIETSILLTEKIAAARPASAELLEKRAMADFAAFGLFKQASLSPHLLRGLALGAGVGIPALGVGHLLLRDARHQGEQLVRDARNQALLTAAGVGTMQGLGELLKSRAQAAPSMPTLPSPQQPMSFEQKLASAILVDDVLEQACELSDPDAKHAALVALAAHRGDAMTLLRSVLT